MEAFTLFKKFRILIKLLQFSGCFPLEMDTDGYISDVKTWKRLLAYFLSSIFLYILTFLGIWTSSYLCDTSIIGLFTIYTEIAADSSTNLVAYIFMWLVSPSLHIGLMYQSFKTENLSKLLNYLNSMNSFNPEKNLGKNGTPMFLTATSGPVLKLAFLLFFLCLGKLFFWTKSDVMTSSVGL